MGINDLEKSLNSHGSLKMPVVFVGHGNPMNATEANAYSDGWIKIAAELPKPAAVLCISAHWLTADTAVAITSQPETIHDFYGFPPELYDISYPAPGAPLLAKELIKHIKFAKVRPDGAWGLDHGAWSVLRRMYPEAKVPVFQMSIAYGKPLRYHFELAKELAFLRSKGVLILASGNMVHNLGAASYGQLEPYDWAVEFDDFVAGCLDDNDQEALLSYEKLGRIAKLAHPTDDHYLPLLYAAGLREPQDSCRFFNEGFDLGSISMRGVIFG